MHRKNSGAARINGQERAFPLVGIRWRRAEVRLAADEDARRIEYSSGLRISGERRVIVNRPARKEAADGADRRDARNAYGANAPNQILLLARRSAGVETPYGCNPNHKSDDKGDISSADFFHENPFLV